MATVVDRLSRRWEMHHPIAFSAAAFGASMLLGPAGYAYADEHKLKVDQLYTCIFTIDTVFTAFLFTFYTFVITADRGFIGRARGSIYFKQTITYTLQSIAVGAVLSVATIPMLIVQPSPRGGDPWLVVSALWAGLATWAVASFVRAAYLFAIFARHQY